MLDQQLKRSAMVALLIVFGAVVNIGPTFARPVQRVSAPAVETVQFRSTLMGKTLPYQVVLPRDYRTARTTRYPVLYLLHGLGGHYSDWITRTNVGDYASRYRMIVVTPEGNDGWYTDSMTVPGDKYESYILQELIPDVQQRYRTIESRYGRAVAGLSMGGYGALKFGLKSPAIFVFAASMSGSTDITSWTDNDFKNFTWIRASVISVFGPEDSATRKANDLFAMVQGMSASRISSLPYFYLDSGTEDFTSPANVKFAALLREKKIPHEYRELPGNHGWDYWNQQVQEVVKIAAMRLHASPLK